MRSATPKVLHKVGGLPMIAHVLAAAGKAGAGRIAVVIGAGAEALRATLGKLAPEAVVHEQAERLGTGHAVLTARKEFAAKPDDVVVLYGDTPLIAAETIGRLRKALARGADIVVLGFRPADPGRYGRLIVDGKQLVGIREYNDASPAERAIGLCNAGVMAFRGTVPPLLKKIGRENAKGEYYLTDLVEIANRAGKKVVILEADAAEVVGVDTRAQLALAERIFQERARSAAMQAGVTLVAPETVTFSHDTRLGQDVTVEPNVFFGAGVEIADGVVIRAFSYIEQAKVASGATIGPYARLRPGAVIGANAHIGNFVEIKNAGIDAGAKVNHLAYIGDAHVGARTNVGAGTITCNYDGFGKYHTEIGADAFIGSNSALVAPVTIGEGAYIGSGSVITKDVTPGALAVARGRQVEKPGWVAVLKARKLIAKKPD